MADQSTTVVLGIPIPSTDPVFLGIVAIHVLFGMAAVIAGAAAMLSRKRRGRHSSRGTTYFWCLCGVFVTMSTLSFMRWPENAHPAPASPYPVCPEAQVKWGRYPGARTVRREMRRRNRFTLFSYF